MPRTNKTYDYDLLIIGSGAGGGVAAHIAGDKGKKVGIIEDDHVGGECPNFGCTPTKALLHAAEIFHTSRHSAQYGIRHDNLRVNFRKVRDWKDLVVLRTGTHDGDAAFGADGVKVIHGHAHFISKHEVSVGTRRYSAKKFLIATGTKNFVPPIPGIEDIDYLTYREAIDIPKPPQSLFVIGGGAIGCEFAQIFASFGSSVHIAEFAPRLLAKEDPEVGELVAAVFKRDFNIKVHTATKVVKLAKKGKDTVVYFEHAGETKKVVVEKVLLAAGKVPNTDLGLENAGVTYSRRGVTVDETMQTSAKHIYAAGDVAGPFMFTHMASYQSRIAAHNMYSSTKIKADYHAVPRCTFVSPEAAGVGMTEQEAKEKGLRVKVAGVPISVIGRSNTTNERTGFVKVITTPQGVLIGASIVAPRAGEMIHELALAVQLGLKAEDVAATIHAFPTWSEAVRVACAKIDA